MARIDASEANLRPVRQLDVFSVDVDDRLGQHLSKVRSSISRSGHFWFKAKTRFNEVLERCRRGTEKRTENNESAQYLLRAPGCDDFLLEVSNGSQSRDVVLSCRQLK
jgi:hypothetical protein